MRGGRLAGLLGTVAVLAVCALLLILSRGEAQSATEPTLRRHRDAPPACTSTATTDTPTSAAPTALSTGVSRGPTSGQGPPAPDGRFMDRSEVEALMEPAADMVARYELAETTTCKEEASRPDSDFESVPLKAPFRLTALVRHASLLTGFSYSELDPVLGAGDAFCAGLAVGDVGRPGVLGHVDPGFMVVFVNASRAALSADPGVDLRRWWTEKRHGKHSTPLGLLLDGRWDEKISRAYRLEISDFPPSAVRSEEDFSFGEQSVFAYRR